MAQQPAQDVDIRTMFDSKYIGSWHLDGRDVVLTIDKVVAGALQKPGQKEADRKPILYFKGTDKGLVLNKTNLATIASIAGSYRAKDWAGVRVALYATTCMAFGKETSCIRVRPTAPKSSAKDAPPPNGPPPEREVGADDVDLAEHES
jgi:hypothetical protein